MHFNTSILRLSPAQLIAGLTSAAVGFEADFLLSKTDAANTVTLLCASANLAYCGYLGWQLHRLKCERKGRRALFAALAMVGTWAAVLATLFVSTTANDVYHPGFMRARESVTWPDLYTGLASVAPVIIVWACGFACCSFIVQRRWYFLPLLGAISIGVLSLVLPLTLIPFPEHHSRALEDVVSMDHYLLFYFSHTIGMMLVATLVSHFLGHRARAK